MNEAATEYSDFACDCGIFAAQVLPGMSGRCTVCSMSVSLKALGIDQLDVEDRLALVEEIWESVAADSSAVPLTLEQTRELERRLAAHEADPDDVVPWADVRASISKLLGK